MDDKYEAVIADLVVKRDNLTRLIVELKMAAGMPSEEPAEPAAGNGKQTIHPYAPGVMLRDDTFFGMQLRQAVRECLRLMDRTMSAPEVAQILKTHGLPSDKKGYTNSVYTALYREQKAGNVVQVPPANKWGLTARYSHLKGVLPKSKVVAAADVATEQEQPA